MSWADDMDRALSMCGHYLNDHDPDTMLCWITACGCPGFEEPEDDDRFADGSLKIFDVRGQA
jgi:hypothetical protein